MLSITAEAATLAAFRQVKGLAEVRDPDGNVLGFFAPVSVERAPLYAQAAARIDREELARRKASKTACFSTREVFEHLKTLTHDPEQLAHLQEKIDGLKERDECVTP